MLFLHRNRPDYLADSLFHGLRTLLGRNCVDAPRYDSMYAPLTGRLRAKLRGHGFTVYGLLEDIPELSEERFFWRGDLDSYDLIVIGNVWLQWELTWELSYLVDPEKLVMLDGADTPTFFPYSRHFMRKRPWSCFVPVSRFKYFKRELIRGHYYGLGVFLPRVLRRWMPLPPLPQNARPISFSVPKEKIWRGAASAKTKDFPVHIVDSEVATNSPGSFVSSTGSSKYVFSSEDEYYDDLRKSRFGITTKRRGWDCLRHYELAASGCVLCFRDLDLKPATCAPHGLNESNCIIYHNYSQLKERLTAITTDEYSRLQEMTYKWIERNTTVARAKQFLEACSHTSGKSSIRK